MMAIRGCASAGTALAYSRRIPPLDRLMLADYDASIRTGENRGSTRSGDPASLVGDILYPGSAGADNPSSIRVNQLSCGAFRT